FGGGANIPVSHFKDDVKTGWTATAGVGADVGSKGLWVEGEGWYTGNSDKVSGAGTVHTWQALGVLGYDLMHGKKTTPYPAVGGGVMHVKGGKTTFAYTGAFGVGFAAGSSTHIFVEGRWTAGTGSNKDAKMIPITAGVSIQVGKKKKM